MKHHPELVVMLTYQDRTVPNAPEIFEECKDSKARFWGFKEEGLPLDKMKKLFAYMKECGKTVCLEVVAYTEEECLKGAQMAVDCGCDYLMGTMFFDSVADYCREHDLKYMPFIGKVSQRPSILEGDIQEMIEEANLCLKKGASGIDLLGYRYTGDAVRLNKEVVSAVDAPVCIAGSVNSYQRLDEVMDAGAWSFTIGGAFFENKFEGTFKEQIDKVCDYISGI